MAESPYLTKPTKDRSYTRSMNFLDFLFSAREDNDFSRRCRDAHTTPHAWNLDRVAVQSAENSGETVAGRGRIENLKPWPKGVSGNPGGRPKNDLAREIAQEVFEQNPEAIYKALTRALLKGNAYLFKQLADRAYGKIADKLEMDVSADLAERLQAARRRASAMMSHQEINDKIKELQADLESRSAKQVE
jgi:hypothetical protein